MYSILSVVVVSLIALIGIVALILSDSFFKKIQTLLVSFAVGTLIGGAVLHILPESLEHDHDRISAIFVLTSFVSFCPLYTPFGINTCKTKQE